MSEWQPIETAPKDGARILLANGKLFAAGYYYIKIGHPTKLRGYDAGPIGSPGWMDVVPNPTAGEVEFEFWDTDPPSAFNEEDVQVPDYDGSFDRWEPTHWMPLPAPPPPTT
jgi:hypothetical protein